MKFARSPRHGSFDAVVDAGGVAKASRHTLLAQLATQVSRLAVNVILARLLTPSDFGVVAAAVVVMVIAWQLTDLGTSAVIIQRDVIDDTLVSSLFYFNLVVGVGLSAGMFAVAGPLASLMGQPHAAPAIQALASVCLIGAVGNMHHGLLRRTMQFSRLAIINIANAVTNGVVGISLAAAGAGIWALVTGTVAGVAVSTITAWWFEGWRPSAVFDLRQLRTVARLAVGFFSSGVLAIGFAQLDKVIIGRVLGSAALGTYAVAQRTVTAPINTVGEAVATVCFSLFAREQNNSEALRAGTTRAAGVVALVVLPSMIGLAVLAEDAVTVVYGAQWEAATPVIQVLAPLAAVQAISRVTASVMSAMGRSDWLYRWAVAYCLIGAGVMLVSSQWGLVGVSFGLAVVVGVLTPFEMKMALGLIEMRLGTFLRSLLPLVVISAIMGTASWLAAAAVERLGTGPGLQLLAGTLTGVVVYVGLLWPARLQAMDDARRVAGRWAGRST